MLQFILLLLIVFSLMVVFRTNSFWGKTVVLLLALALTLGLFFSSPVSKKTNVNHRVDDFTLSVDANNHGNGKERYANAHHFLANVRKVDNTSFNAPNNISIRSTLLLCPSSSTKPDLGKQNLNLQMDCETILHRKTRVFRNSITDESIQQPFQNRNETAPIQRQHSLLTFNLVLQTDASLKKRLQRKLEDKPGFEETWHHKIIDFEW